MSVHFDAFKFVESEKALSLFNSKGKEQGRIHLFKYDGDEHKDRYAIAAEKIEFGAGELPSLGWLDRKFYVIMEHDNTTYKVNRNSFEKRTGIKLDDFADEETGVCSDTLDTVLGERAAELAKWNSMMIIEPNQDNQTFIKNFFQSLVSANIPPHLYGHVHFHSADVGEACQINNLDNTPFLLVHYGKRETIEEPDQNDPSIYVVNIRGDEYKGILKGHPVSEEILTKVNYFAADLELIKQHFKKPLATAFPNAKLILTNEQRHSFDSVVGTSMQEIVNNALTATTEIREAQLIIQTDSKHFTVYYIEDHKPKLSHYISPESLAESLELSPDDMHVFK